MKLLLSFAFVLILTGCAKYIHIYQTKPSAMTSNQETSFDNDTVRVEYNFWAEGGKVSFSVYNKLNVPLYVDWRKSSFVKNKDKFNYWEDIIKTKSSQRLSPTLFTNEVIGTGQSVSDKPEQITFIPPKSTIHRTQYAVKPGVDYLFKSAEPPYFLEENNSSKKIEIVERIFDEDRTPVHFRNFMTLSTSDKFSNEFYIDNGFYVSSILQVRYKDFVGSNPKIPKTLEQRSIFQVPDRFYNYALSR